jgi:CRISPR/Cas system CMR subunit Cmr4 (Cas7 group RAMP superfamily)
MTGLFIARVTIEAVAPLSVGSGEAGVSDVSLVRDANGLPMITGASLQGLIKALAGPDTGLLGDTDMRGQIMFSDARIQGGDDKAVSCLHLRGITDGLLKHYLVDEPLKRDHVKIDHRGTSEDHHKFDRAALPRGTRFSFELTMWGNEGDRQAFESILELIHHPLFRPGGATRRGYGRVKLVVGRWNFWDKPLDEAETIYKVRAKPYSYIPADWNAIEARSSNDVKRHIVTLTTKSWWRAGADGERVQTNKYRHPSADNRDKDTDLAFTREPSICWEPGHNGDRWIESGDKIAENYVLAGSAIRGALWHRTLYHWNLRNNCLIDADAPDKDAFGAALLPPPEILALFGEVKEGNKGQRAALIIDDVVFKPKAVTAADHVSIDRFTGGARTGALFSEELVQIEDAGIEVNIIIDDALLSSRALQCLFDEKDILKAFKAAVNDLCNGRLALGAKSSGFFTGKCEPAIMAEAGQ